MSKQLDEPTALVLELAQLVHNYVLDLESPHADEVIGHALRADRTDLRTLLQSVSVTRIAEEALFRAEELLQLDRPAEHIARRAARGLSSALTPRIRGLNSVRTQGFGNFLPKPWFWGNIWKQ